MCGVQAEIDFNSALPSHSPAAPPPALLHRLPTPGSAEGGAGAGTAPAPPPALTPQLSRSSALGGGRPLPSEVQEVGVGPFFQMWGGWAWCLCFCWVGLQAGLGLGQASGGPALCWGGLQAGLCFVMCRRQEGRSAGCRAVGGWGGGGGGGGAGRQAMPGSQALHPLITVVGTGWTLGWTPLGRYRLDPGLDPPR